MGSRRLIVTINGQPVTTTKGVDMAQRHINTDDRGNRFVYLADPSCIADDCTREHAYVFSSDELEQRDAIQRVRYSSGGQSTF
jgi:hypothetical protein